MLNFALSSMILRLGMILRIVALLVFIAAPDAFAAPGITVLPSGADQYVVQGGDFSGIGGVDITLRYDTSSISNPRVTVAGLASGALMAVNSSTPGVLRFALIRTTAISGSGPIATMNFSRLASTGQDILSMAATAAMPEGKTDVTLLTKIVNATPASADTSEGATNPPSGASSEAGATPAARNAPGASQPSPAVGAGIVIVPVPASTEGKPSPATAPEQQPIAEAQQPKKEQADKNAPPEPVMTASREKTAAEPALKRVMMYQSVLERFKEYKGEKTPKALMDLFSGKERGIQAPPPVLSNGMSTVKVVLELDSRGENNNFQIDNATLVSINNAGKDQWVAELLPDKRVWEASIAIPRNRQLNVMPLTVSPAVDLTPIRQSGRLTESDFKRFLKERGTAKSPRFDLNGDGVRDYIDDYIFTANYLIRHKQNENTAKSR